MPDQSLTASRLPEPQPRRSWLWLSGVASGTLLLAATIVFRNDLGLPGGYVPYAVGVAFATVVAAAMWALSSRTATVPAGAVELARVEGGSIVDPPALEFLESVIEPGRGVGATPLPDLLPPLQTLGHLQALAWEVLEGNPVSAGRFRVELSRFGDGGFGRRWWPAYRPRRRTIRGHDPLLPMERLLPVVLAAARAARSGNEAERLVGAVTRGQSGSARLAHIFDEAVRAFHTGDSIPLRSQLDFAARTRPWLLVDPRSFPLPGEPWIEEPPLPIPVPPPWPWDPNHFEGFFGIDVSSVLDAVRPAGDAYEITGVSPPDACPGTRLELTGTGFGGVRYVYFMGPGRRGIPVEPERRPPPTDTTLWVTVPERAVPGPIWLAIPERVLVSTSSGVRSIAVNLPGSAGAFAGGTAHITYRLSGGTGGGGPYCLRRTEPATLTWAVEPSTAIVEIAWGLPSGAPVQLYRGPAGEGATATRLPTESLGSFDLTIEAEVPNGACAATTRSIGVVVGESPALTITGVEVTQGIQTFDSRARDDNSVPLIAGKDTIVRVYVTHDWSPDPINVTGVMLLRGTRYPPINTNAAGAADPFIAAGGGSACRRETNCSLNFRIPAAEAQGTGTITVEVFRHDWCPRPVPARHREQVEWLERRALPVTVRRIQDPHSVDAVISEDDACQLIEDAFDRLPSPATEIRPHPGVFVLRPATAESDYCGAGMLALSHSVAFEHNGVEGGVWPWDPPHRSIWVGVFFSEDCPARGMRAWPFQTTCVTGRDAETAAHEIAHCVGMGHTVTVRGEPCAQVDQPIACHVLPGGGLLEDTPFDAGSGEAVPNAWDLMSYGRPRFPHPDHWEMIRNGMDAFIAASGR